MKNHKPTHAQVDEYVVVYENVVVPTNNSPKGGKKNQK